MSKNIIFMVSVQKDTHSVNQAHEYSIKAWGEWASRNNSELFLLTNDVFNPPQWNKILSFRLLEENNIDYDRILYVDAVTIPHPEMPNIFEQFPSGTFYGVRNYGSMDWVLRSIEAYQYFLFNEVELQWENYINSGVMLYDKSHRKLFEWILNFYLEHQEKLHEVQKLGVGKDQPVINFALEVNSVPRKILPYEWNMQDLMRFELLASDLLYTKFGWIYHFNAGVKPTPRYWMEFTYNNLYVT